MLGRLQPTRLQRLQCLEPSFHTACSLTQAAADGPTADSKPQQSRQPSRGGAPNRPRANPGKDSSPSDRLNRQNFGSRSSDGPSRAGGSFRQQKGGGGGGGGGGGQRNPQGGHRRPQQHGGGGGGGKQNVIEAALGSPRSGPPKTGADAFMQYLTPTAINSDLLPIADYILKPQVAPPRPNRSYQQRDGRGGGNFNREMGPDPRLEAAKLRNVLLRSPSKVSRVIQKQMDLNSDPNYRIEDVLKYSSSAASNSSSPEETLDSLKAELTSMLGISEDDFERYKQEAVAAFKQDTMPMLEQQDPRVREQELEKLLDNITPEHEYYEAIVTKFRVLQSNPNWTHEKKLIFARRLLKHLS